MLQENQMILFISLAIVVFGLSIYLGFIFNQLKKQKELSLLKEKEYQEALKKREESILESLRLLSRAIINEQCEISEGCIRITKLKVIIPKLEENKDLKIFNQMYTEIERFPILETRNALSSKEKFNQDKERFRIEDIYKDQIIKACSSLLEAIEQY
jgi:hypothetical protein